MSGEWRYVYKPDRISRLEQNSTASILSVTRRIGNDGPNDNWMCYVNMRILIWFVSNVSSFKYS